MHRILVPPRALAERAVAIRDARSLHHLRHVLRVRTGERLECFDGQGRSVIGTVVSSDEKELVVAVETVAQERRASVELVLAHALIRPARFDWVVEKATELGVDRIVPLATARAVARLTAAQCEGKRLRWQRIAAEAARQCRRSTVPGIEAVADVARFLERLPECRAVIPTLAGSAIPLGEALRQLQDVGRLVILIGPEGDFTPAEVARAKDAGAVPVSLGRLTLRSETAALACLAVVQHLLGAKPQDRRG